MEQASDLEPNYWRRKGTVITAMLDEIYPITVEMPEDIVEGIEIERQMLVMRAGWNMLEPAELEGLWLQSHDTLPALYEN